MKTLLGVALSQTTILNYVQRLYALLAEWESESIEQLIEHKALNTDETSMRVNKKNQWVHVISSGDITLKFLHPKRGKKALEDFGIIPRYTGMIIHDCWSSYLSYDHCEHGLCGSHLLRELAFIIESNNYRWAENMKRLLRETCKTVSSRTGKKLTDKEYQNLQKRYRNILPRGAKEMPPIPPKPKGQRGKIAKSDAHNLWERLNTYEEAVLLFAKAYCRISSYLQTMANKGVNPLLALQIALQGNAAELCRK